MKEGARFYSPVHNGPGTHSASYTEGIGSFPGAKRRGINHPLHLAPKLKKKYSVITVPLYAFITGYRVNCILDWKWCERKWP